MIGKEMWKFSTRRYFPSPLVYPQINPRCRADCFILTCAFLFCLRTIPVNPSLIVIHFWGRDAFSARLSSRVSELQRSFRIILYFFFFFPPIGFLNNGEMTRKKKFGFLLFSISFLLLWFDWKIIVESRNARRILTLELYGRGIIFKTLWRILSYSQPSFRVQLIFIGVLESLNLR